MGIRSYLAAILLLSFISSVSAQTQTMQQYRAKQLWVDSVYNNLNDTERIGQLFMVAAYSGGKDYNEEKIAALIAAHKIGGLIFMQGTPEAQAVQTNRFQQMAQVPLLIGMDAEWGLGMRLTGVKDFPRAMMIGAAHDSAMMYRAGAAVAMQCKRLGVHIDFAPVVDVNNNPNNPIINARSFGENKYWVARLGLAYMKGLQDNGVMACAKHFPGHGDTKTDSHVDLPKIDKTFAELDTLELYPFRALIKAGIKSVMVAHLEVPALGTEPHIPTTLSKTTITSILKGRMGFKGLVFTDALNMDGVAKYFEPGEVDVRAFKAGNDMLLFSQNVPVAIEKMMAALADSSITRAELEQRVKKILAAKYDAGLYRVQKIDEYNVTNDLNQYTAAIRSRIADAAITLVRDRNNVVDRLAQKGLKIGYIGVNAQDSTTLYGQLKQAVPGMLPMWLPKGTSDNRVLTILDTMTNRNDLNIVAIHNMAFYPGSSGNHGLDDRQVAFLKQLEARKDVMIVLLGNAYWLKNICNIGSALVTYEDDSITETIAARVLLRKEDAKGSLPVTPCDGMVTEGRSTLLVNVAPSEPAQQLKGTIFAEDAGVVNKLALDKLNMFIQRSISDGAFPGCQLVAAKDGIVFYNKAYGYYDYNKSIPIDTNTLFDVASVTKVLSTTLAVMRLYEQGKLDLNKTAGDYLPITKGTDKANLRIKDMLLHQAGLKSWIPFYKETMDDKGNLRSELYSKVMNDKFSIQVAKDLYLRNDYVDTIWSTILNSPLENKGKYVYSDLDFYFLAAIVQQITGKRIDAYVEEQFYKPLGLKRTTYLPLKKFKETEIAATENDLFFRKQNIRGYVHDQGAALLGGVAGHAGLFSTGSDVAVIFQMLMNKGEYKNKRYFKKETVDYFTAYNSRISRRGLGFDKPSADKDDAGPAGNRVSGYAFGHQGFTGTCAWADPETGVVFVFLSNRVYPSPDNGLINKLSVRTIAQDYIYEALGFPINSNRPEVYKAQLSSSK